MGYFDKLAELGFVVVCRRNRLNSTTMFALRPDELDGSYVTKLAMTLDDVLAALPEWRLVDFSGDQADFGARMLYEKLTMTGWYVGHDERVAFVCGPNMPKLGFEHRPESERFQPVEDAPAPPPELVENLNLQGP